MQGVRIVSERTTQARGGAVACVLALLLAACGSGAFTAPGGEDDSDGSSPTTSVTKTEDDGDDGGGDDGGGENGDGEDDGDDGTDFSIFALPGGPRTPADVVEDDVYVPLQAGDCGEARSTLDTVWQDLKSPRSVLLYEAGVSLCAGDRDASGRWLDGAAAYGLGGMDREFFVLDADGQDAGTYRYDCELYKSLVGALRLVSRDGVTCESGEAPAWPEVDPRQDPRDGDAPETPEPGDGQATEPGDGEATEGPAPDTDGTAGTESPDGSGTQDGTDGLPAPAQG